MRWSRKGREGGEGSENSPAIDGWVNAFGPIESRRDERTQPIQVQFFRPCGARAACLQIPALKRCAIFAEASAQATANVRWQAAREVIGWRAMSDFAIISTWKRKLAIFLIVLPFFIPFRWLADQWTPVPPVPHHRHVEFTWLLLVFAVAVPCQFVGLLLFYRDQYRRGLVRLLLVPATLLMGITVFVWLVSIGDLLAHFQKKPSPPSPPSRDSRRN
jgi:hypothetical protein